MGPFRIIHKNTYKYKEDVGLCHNELHLKPRDTPNQRLLDFRIQIRPEPVLLHPRMDYYGNPVHYASIQSSHGVLEVLSDSIVELMDQKAWPSVSVSLVREWIAAVSGDAAIEVIEFLLDSPMVGRSDVLSRYGEDLFQDHFDFLTAVHNLTQRIYKDFEYLGGVTHADTTVLESFEKKKGVCQDFAHVGVGILRSLGFPARYVSGYLETFPPPGKPKLIGSDASHAWFSAFIPGYGWFDFDPTNNKPTDHSYITTSLGRDYSDVTPIKGVIFGGGEHTVDVGVDVIRLEEGITSLMQLPPAP